MFEIPVNEKNEEPVGAVRSGLQLPPIPLYVHLIIAGVVAVYLGISLKFLDDVLLVLVDDYRTEHDYVIPSLSVFFLLVFISVRGNRLNWQLSTWFLYVPFSIILPIVFLASARTILNAPELFDGVYFNIGDCYRPNGVVCGEGFAHMVFMRTIAILPVVILGPFLYWVLIGIIYPKLAKLNVAPLKFKSILSSSVRYNQVAEVSENSRKSVREDILLSAYNNVLPEALLYFNLVLFGTLILAANGLSFETAMRFFFTALFLFLFSALGVRWAYRNLNSREVFFVIAAAAVLNDITPGVVLIFDLMAAERALLDPAIATVIAVSIVSLAISTRFLVPFFIGKIALYTLCTVYIIFRDDVEKDIPGLVAIMVFLFIMVSLVGYWVHRKNVEQLLLRHKLSETMAAERNAHKLNNREYILRERLIKYIGHDVRQPINAIGYILFKMQQLSSDDVTAKSIADAKACVQDANALIKDIIDLSMYAKADQTLTVTHVSLADVFDIIERDYRGRAAEQGVNLRIVDSAIYVAADLQMLTRILLNLVSNALSYAHNSDIVIGVRRRKGTCEIQIADQGPGLSEQTQKHLFEEYFRGDSPSDPAGFGLGLKIAYDLAVLNGAELKVSSRVGAGSIFSCIFRL